MIGLGFNMARAARRKVAATYTGPVFDFLTPSVSTQEGNTGTTIMGFVVQRFGSLAGTDVLNYAVTGFGVNAAQTSNFPGGVMPSGTVTFSPADTSKTIYIVVQTNTAYDVDRDYLLTLSGQSHILNPVAFGTIVNDDPVSPAPGASPPTLPTTLTVRYHPNSQNATLNGSNQVLDCADLLGLAGVVGVAAIGANTIKNPKMVGVVAGTPGTLPTNWSIGGAAGLTTSVIGTGTEKGMAYVDIRLNGTTSGTFTTILMEAASVIAAVNAQAWSGSATLSVVGGSQTNISSIALTTNVLDVGAAVLQQISTTAAVTGTATRFTNSGTTANASTAFVRPLIGVNYSSGVAIDVTLRIAYPALEQAAAATTPATIGPVQMTDALGRKFWRFNPGQALTIANTLTGLHSRQITVFMVGRQHKVTRGMDMPIFSTRYSAYTNDTTNTARTNGYVLRTQCNTGTSEVPRLKSGSTDSFAGHANSPLMVPGAQLHVMGFASRAGASAGTDVGGRFFMNNFTVPTAQSSLTGTADVGGIIGGKATSSNGITGTADTGFDLYDFVLIKGTLTDAQADAVAAALVSGYAIPTLDGQLILEGDSQTECIDKTDTVVVPADNMAVVLSAPGAEAVPTSFRVINAAIAGSALATFGGITGVVLSAHRDDTAGPFKYVFAGGPSKNVITCNVGINDMRSSGGNLSAATHYANFVALLNTTTTGYLQRGFSVVAVTPTAISGDSTGQGRIAAFRDMLVDPTTDEPVPQFLTDVLANTGQTYDGRVSVLPLCKVQNGASGTVFLDATDAADTAYYAGDGTHNNATGYQLQATGGDTPQYGYVGLFDLVSPPAQFSLSGAQSQVEGNTGTTTWTYTIFRTGNLIGTASVDWVVQASGSNPAPTSRFTGGVYPSGVANFGDGIDYVDVSFTTLTDAIDQPDETFALGLLNPTAASGTAKLASPFNASGTILNDDAITGGPQIINLGSAAATEDFIRTGYGTEWVATGTPTQTRTAYNPADLLTYWKQAVAAAFTERWEITCDWDGMLTYTTSEASYLGLFGKKSTTQGWADNGGWVKIKGAAGKRPGIANRIKTLGWRGVEVTNLIGAGTWDGATYTNGTGKQNAQSCIIIGTNSSYPAEPIVNINGCAFSRMFVASATSPDYSICGILSSGLSEQITVTNCSLEGTYFAMSLLARKTRVSGNDIHKSNGDYIQLNGHSKKSGYYAYAIIEYNTERGPIQSLAYRSLHQDGCQTGASKDIHLGYRVLFKGNRWHLDHMYQGLPGLGGGTNASYNDDYLNADNLFCLIDDSFHAASVHSFTYHSPKATYRSYVSRCNLGRCGRVPSQFTGDTYPPEDYSPGIYGNSFKPKLPGIALTVEDSLIGWSLSSDPQVQTINCVLLDYKIGGVIRPEIVYNGRDFERGGVLTSNGISDKFGYILPHEITGTQADFLNDMNANWTPQGAYASKGAPAAVLSNYNAVSKPAWAT